MTAIAYVNSADLGDNGGTSNNRSSAFDATGANLLVVSVVGDLRGGFDDITGVTYAGVTIPPTQSIKNISGASIERYTYLYYLLAPTTGSNSVVVSCTNNHFLLIGAACYSGVGQTGQPDATAVSVQTVGSSTFTSSITTVANNSWAVLFSENSGTAVSGGTGTTLRAFGVTYNDWGLFDSNGPLTPAGSYGMTSTIAANTADTQQHLILSFSPTVAQLPYRRFSRTYLCR